MPPTHWQNITCPSDLGESFIRDASLTHHASRPTEDEGNDRNWKNDNSPHLPGRLSASPVWLLCTTRVCPLLASAQQIRCGCRWDTFPPELEHVAETDTEKRHDTRHTPVNLTTDHSASRRCRTKQSTTRANENSSRHHRQYHHSDGVANYWRHLSLIIMS